jgi:hypothetical protein
MTFDPPNIDFKQEIKFSISAIYNVENDVDVLIKAS